MAHKISAAADYDWTVINDDKLPRKKPKAWKRSLKVGEFDFKSLFDWLLELTKVYVEN